MAKVVGPLMSMGASGRFGAVVFDKRNFVRQFVAPANPQTTAQMTQRNTLGDVARQLKLIGATVRAELKAGLGYRWFSILQKELLTNGGALLTSLEATYTAFSAPNKAAWAGEDTSSPVVLEAGFSLYACAKATKDYCTRVGVAVSITAPIETNAATVGGEWVA